MSIDFVELTADIVARVRLFLTQSDLSVENGFARLKPKSGFRTQSKKIYFDSTFFDRVFRLMPSFTTGGSSRKTLLSRLDLPVEKLRLKSFTRVLLTHRIAHPTPMHMPTHPYQVPYGSCCSHINSHNQVRGHRTGSSHSGAEEYPREEHKPKVVHAYQVYHS